MLFEPTLSRLEQPGQPGYPAYDVDIVSAELPCGAAWLATALLELGIPLWRPWGIDDQQAWTLCSPRVWQYQFPDNGWSRLVPSLIDGREFRLRLRPVPRFGHHWAGTLQHCTRRILYVRDPRDALFSAWRRERRMRGTEDGVDFSTWAGLPFAHLPLSRVEYLRCFWQAWLNADDAADVLVLRFEDSKRDPQRCLRQVLKFLGLNISARAIAAACKAASHARAAQADRVLAQAGIGPVLLGDGIAEEWRGHFTPAMHAALGTTFDALCRRLNYAVNPIAAESPPIAVDATALAAALLLHQAEIEGRHVRLSASLAKSLQLAPAV